MRFVSAQKAPTCKALFFRDVDRSLTYPRAIAKLENFRVRLEDLEDRSERFETAFKALSKSVQRLGENLDELDLRAEKSADDAYAATTLLIDIVTKQLHINMVDLKELQQYQQRSEGQG
jgi:predicted nuclease with TOPRIM domain